MRVRIAIAVDRSDPTPMHRQIHEQVRRLILTGRVRQGERLPGSRRLATELGVSRTVVASAYDLLYADGFVEPQHGSGTVVADVELPATRPVRAGAPAVAGPGSFAVPSRSDLKIDFRPGVPAWTDFPKLVWSRMHADAMLRARPSDVGYGPAEGVPELRRALSTHLRVRRGAAIPPERLVVTTGATQAIDLVGRTLIGPGSVVVLEEPSHPVLRRIFENLGATLVPVPVDDDGLDVAQIPAALDAAGVRPEQVALVYVTPSHQFPTGVAMSLARRLQLVELCERHAAWILEDDYDSDVVLERVPSALAGIDPHRTIIVGTFSKSLFPALRIGFVGLPPELLDGLLEQKWLSDRLSSTLDQVVLAELLMTGRYAKHVSALKTSAQLRRTALVDGLVARFGAAVRVRGLSAGLHAFVELDLPLDVLELVAACEARGVGIHEAGQFYADSRRAAGPTLLFGFAALDEGTIERGLDVIAQEAHRLLDHRPAQRA